MCQSSFDGFDNNLFGEVMYYFFATYSQAKTFMDSNENSKLVAWACGSLFDQYAVFVQKVSERQPHV